jgi:ribosomal protein S18 acetylase RimI-like enzyme
MDTLIRKANLRDVPRIVELWKSFWNEHDEKYTRGNPIFKSKQNKLSYYKKFVARMIRSRNASVFVAGIDDKLVGHIIVGITKLPPIYIHDKEAHVHEIYVEKKYRNKGIGTKLLVAANSFAKEKGIFSLGLTVNIKNKEAFSLYKESGFKEHNLKMSKIVK